MLVYACLLLIVVTVCGKSIPLPPYITACTRDDPKILNACALRRGREAIPKFIDGDRKYKIPVLDPMEISHLHVNEGVLGLNFTTEKMLIRGLRKAKLDSINWDIVAQTGDYRISVPRLEAVGHYNINGRILILPVTGNGIGNLTFTDVKVKYTFGYDLVKREDGLRNMLIKDSKLSYNTSRMYVNMENLFNGNKLLGDQTNLFMNENWKDMFQELGPLMGDSVGEVFQQIQYNIFQLVDYESALLPKRP